MTTAPNPTVSLSTIDGITRTLDDWTTMFRQCWIVLPSKAEAVDIIPVAEAIFKTFGESDARCAFLVPGNTEAAKRLRALTDIKAQWFIDPEFTICDSLGITQAPTLIYIRQDTQVEYIAQGYNLAAWEKTVADIAKSLRWTVPELSQFSKIHSHSYLVK